ncbi:methyltransferase domain-containing protein [Mesorhizobium sp. CGMCC 1.15528]|uniref:Methyltransferase domain-containing protein n=1 Tax=Mesorhizobium zhangyense TaxID=1776730 RepID=A0A7C9V936_9HYPH|nr:class I SAM-dependent methyltransferase [Mesorhizobium zhangyense]NGN43885.1 methyltransferase domain-containing protein [Mesorhizobium zhangyense]
MHDVPYLHTTHVRSNFDVKEQIREYWSRRSETFDQSPAHGIHSKRELATWKRLIGDSAEGIGGGRVLELASGTGEFTRVLRALGCEVEGLDLSEAMIERASRKHGNDVRFYLGDAENAMLPDGRYDAVVCRHLVWTLLAPEDAFRDWLRVLKPGGHLVIIDGNWQHQALVAKVAARVAKIWDRISPRAVLYDAVAHRLIQDQLYFREGLLPDRLTGMLRDAGFTDGHTGPLQGVLASQLRAAGCGATVLAFCSRSAGPSS